MPRPDHPPKPPSTLELIGTTPLRDVVRGRLTGRLDIPSALEDLDLPPEIAEHLGRAVEKAGIPALHRPAVARQFGEDARSWLDEGRDAAAVMRLLGARRGLSRLMRDMHDAEFGTPIGRRVRRFAWRKGRWALLTLVIIYALAAWRFWTGRPNIARNFAQEWNQRIEAIPAEDRAWPLYLDVLRIRRRDDYFEPGWDQPRPPDWQSAQPGDPLWPEVLRYLEWSREALAIVRKAAAKPGVGLPLSDVLDPSLRAIFPETAYRSAASPNPPVVNIMMPALGYQRSFARWLNVDLRAAASEGDSERALADSLAMLGLARQALEPGAAMAQATNRSILVMTGHAIASALHDHPDLWSEPQLEVLARALAAATPADARFRYDTTFDRAFLLDFLQRAYTDDGAGNGRLTAAGMAEIARMGSPGSSGSMTISRAIFGPLVARSAPSRRALWSDWDRRLRLVEAQLEARIWDVPDIARLVAPPASRTSHVFYTLPDITLPTIMKGYKAAELTTQDHAAARTIVAIHRFRAAHGEWPDRLAALVPEFLDALPVDTADGAPLRYARRDAGFVLYALGLDGDDDTGVQSVAPSGEARKGWYPPELRASAPDGDVVYWPPHRMPRVETESESAVSDLSEAGGDALR